jgi:hypothetical protein
MASYTALSVFVFCRTKRDGSVARQANQRAFVETEAVKREGAARDAEYLAEIIGKPIFTFG